ncbi:TMV resistance protein N-like [Eucalyptus grandis]|uniref:TMV resistance protein N-like n=1 Tax=Eucalyptus grandis TaxID=71139 RepID=UPI00192EBE2E|nr:TMV resistance protein N-like [Eucalyptus grandis]
MGKSSKAEIRGEDQILQGFTDCLYHGMLDANICVFFDKEELHIGKEIGNELSTAIEKSKIYIPIFSKGYASSAWCLHELAHMVECKKSKPSEKEILPIFYDMEPRDVKLKSELYVSALMKHEDMFGRQRRLKWEDALRSVAQIKGWELKNQGYWKFIKSVIQEIVMKLKTKDKYVAEHIVRMDEQVEAVVELLDVDSKVMRFVLIHGMGGIGFRDVINDVDDGIKMIAQQLSNKKVFIVLDDVGNEEQLEKLAIKHISFGLGSKIIITTRNKSILKAYQTLEYEVKPLDSVQSLELFSRRAFKRNFPPDDYVSLSRQVVSTTGGLPLALEVIGSLLHRQNKALWIDVLNHQKEIPYEKVQDKLKISYNVLSHEQKQIFLDIACMFVDKDKTNASYMWKDCRFFPVFDSSPCLHVPDQDN